MELLERLQAALGDRYRVERELGRGGMAIVFLAEDLKHHRRVAIKVLGPSLSAVIGGERFLREIAIAATLQHPHIVPLYDSGQADDLLYYVMPYVEGESLSYKLARDYRLPLETALQFTREVGSALQYAHDHGVVHRDIKPDNILLSGDHAVVTDFGIARALDSASSGSERLTMTGVSIGTPQYMSPEAADGGDVDARTDQYSLACTLYEMLAGKPPFTAPTPMATLAKHSLDPVPDVRSLTPAVPAHIAAAIERAMAKRPDDRFASVRAFVDALDAPDGRSAARTTTSAPSAARPSSRRRGVAIALGVGALLVAGAFWFATTRTRTANAPSRGKPNAVAVLPFEDLGGGTDSSYIAAGVTEGMVTSLAEIGSLKVLSRSAGAASGAAPHSIGKIGKQLKVDGIVMGSVGRTADTVDVRIRLLAARDSSVLFAKEYRRLLGDLPNLQREIAMTIAGAMHASLAEDQKKRLSRHSDVDQPAYDAYLRGRFYMDQGELDGAKSQFERAIAIDPKWAPPYVGLANYYSTIPFASSVSPADALPKARSALARAIQLDESLPEAHAAQAYISAYYDLDGRAAEQEFKRALELRPNYGDAYFSYSRFLASRRRLDEAIAQLGHAMELDPLDPSLEANLALLDYFAGHNDTAYRRLQGLVARDSTDVLAQWGRALVAEQLGRPNEAIATLEQYAGQSPNRRSSLAHAYAVAGRQAEARKILDDLRRQAETTKYVPSYFFAVIYTGLGDRDEALRSLEHAFEERSSVVAYLLIDPRLAPLREEPRFLALARRLEGGE